MNLKKTLSVILALSTMAASAAAFAEDDVMLISSYDDEVMLINEEPAETEPLNTYDKAVLYGTATMSDGCIYIETENGDVVVNVDENTLYVDANGYKTTIEEVDSGDVISVIASHAMTMSIPPQSYAYVIMLADENGGFPIYAEVDRVVTDDNGNFVYSSKDGNYDVVYGEGVTAVEPFATRNIVTSADIKEGSRILVYADIMTMSIPAMVPANRIVILPEVTEIVEAPYAVTVNGEAIDADILNKDGMILVPVRAVAEKLGLEVKWDAGLNAVSVGTVPMGVTFNVNENSYTKARMMPQTLSSAPVVENERTYVPVDFFTEILEAQTSIENGVLNIVR